MACWGESARPAAARTLPAGAARTPCRRRCPGRRRSPPTAWSPRSFLALELLNGARLLRQRRKELLELLVVLVGRHARLSQPQPGDLILELPLFLERGTQRRVGHLRDVRRARGVRFQKHGAGCAGAAVLERGVLAQDVPFAFERLLD